MLKVIDNREYNHSNKCVPFSSLSSTNTISKSKLRIRTQLFVTVLHLYCIFEMF